MSTFFEPRCPFLYTSPFDGLTDSLLWGHLGTGRET
jgi:hypothetical protein